MSGLETLPPDQRAVLQLILAQRRGYRELAELLQIDVAAVRARAHAGLDTLADPTDAPADDQRARIADYLLGQQDEGERFVTLAQLGESDGAARWASALRARLAPLASIPIPAVPGPAASNGTTAVQAPPPVPTPPPQPPPPAPPAVPTDDAPRPSRLGGAILLVLVVAIVAVLAVALTGGDDEPMRSAGTPTTPQTTGTTPQGDDVVPVAQVNLVSTPAGGKAVGIALVQVVSGSRLVLAVEAQKLPANGEGDIYALWLRGPSGTKLLGYFPRQVGSDGNASVTADLPNDLRKYGTVLVTREAAEGAAAKQPGTAILSGALELPS